MEAVNIFNVMGRRVYKKNKIFGELSISNDVQILRYMNKTWSEGQTPQVCLQGGGGVYG